ncbi:MAG: winged helix-turn-helix domain-containing protein [Thaumarchaeota archaeon]|nr:winged helix-turn-helix domain-containing protein [Nitrososphaerota archaeon]
MRTTFWITQIRNIGKMLNRPHTTINGWLLRAVQLGIQGRYEMMREGRSCRLNPKQFAQLYADITAEPNECGFESKVWTCRIIVIHVKKRFGVQYTEHGRYNLLDRLNFSYKKPRQKHPKSASRQAINKFKRESNAIVKKYSNKNYKIFADDE